jgi:hypothetical protein
MTIFNHEKEDYIPTKNVKSNSPIKGIAIGLGILIGAAHIAMAGTSIAAGLVVPAVSSIPYVGWLAGGWALLLGQQAGSELGSQVGEVFNDC